MADTGGKKPVVPVVPVVPVSEERCKASDPIMANGKTVNKLGRHFSNSCSRKNNCNLVLDATDPSENADYLAACGDAGTAGSCRDQTCSCPCYSPFKTTCICPVNAPAQEGCDLITCEFNGSWCKPLKTNTANCPKARCMDYYPQAPIMLDCDENCETPDGTRCLPYSVSKIL